ncbi:MAG TPA: phospholipid carrier-dependent glycosyltransferase [Verrucomicrobiae bacterium]|nr:phospholipid carrier-dependent glycosyltransferase [Verrucomicrobiae bacterium]
MRTTVQIGGDEGFELAKATLCLNGHKLYSDVWNDQPPFHTLLITAALKHVSQSILVPRSVTIGFASLLLASVFIISRQTGSSLTATIAALLLMVSPGFLGLSASVMLEIPSLAMTIAGLCTLIWGAKQPQRLSFHCTVAGILFGLALSMKLVPVYLLPLAAFIIWRTSSLAKDTLSDKVKRCVFRFAIFMGTSALTFAGVDFVIEGGAYLKHFGQSWTSHFAPAQSFEYGSAADYPFDWAILLKHWDTVIPALLGCVASWRARRNHPLSLLPVVWLGLALAVFTVHKPWWPYYYPHLAIPLSLCAGIGITAVWSSLKTNYSNPDGWLRWSLPALFALCAVAWIGGRLYFHITEIRNSPRTFSTLALVEMERYKPHVEWLYADEPIYSFHSGIPLPPPLAVVMLKRFWSGEMTNQRIADEVRNYRPGLVLLKNDTRAVPFKDFLESDYQLVYFDSTHRLYASKAVLNSLRSQ